MKCYSSINLFLPLHAPEIYVHHYLTLERLTNLFLIMPLSTHKNLVQYSTTMQEFHKHAFKPASNPYLSEIVYSYSLLFRMLHQHFTMTK